VSGGKLPNVYHFDSKADVEEYIRSIGIPASFFLPGFYMSNFDGMGLLSRSDEDGAWTLALPVSPKAIFPLFDVTDTGKYVKTIVLNRDKLLGDRFLASTEYLTAQEVLDTFKAVYPEAGKTAKFFQLPREVFEAVNKQKGMPDFVILEMYENFALLEEFGYYGGADLGATHELVQDHLTTWKEYISKAKKFEGLA